MADDPALGPYFSGVKQPAFDTLVSSHARAVGQLDQLATDMWAQLNKVGVDTSPALRIRALAGRMRGQGADLRSRQTRVHAMEQAPGPHWSTPSGTYWPLPDGPPPPLPPVLLPPTCKPETPEYCHKSGTNLMTPELLLAQWLLAEAEGAPGQSKSFTMEYFRDGDPLTEEVKGLVTLDSARKKIEMAIAGGSYSGTAHFHLADMTPEQRKWFALNNAFGIATRGQRGMQHPLAFIGSYDLEWKVVGVDANGNPVVEYHLHNASTRGSGSLDKSKVQNYGDGESADSPDSAAPGEQYTRQSFRWRETYVNGRAQVHSHPRESPLPSFPPGNRWHDPTTKDPLIPDPLYIAMEQAIERALP